MYDTLRRMHLYFSVADINFLKLEQNKFSQIYTMFCVFNQNLHHLYFNWFELGYFSNVVT